MAQIRIERTPIKAFALGFFGADHLLLTLVPDEFADPLLQENWFVLEGVKASGPAPILGVEGTDGQTTLSEANGLRTGSDLVAWIGTPQARSSTVLDLPLGAFESWDIMADFGTDLDDQFLPYLFYGEPAQPHPTSNSTSVIATLLFHIGIDLSAVSPVSWLRYTTGAHTLLGTSERDEMYITSSYTALLGGVGSDIFHGSDGGDIFNGGRDADFFHWSKGFDQILGGERNLEYARDGTDVMGYAGVGTIRIDFNPLWKTHVFPNHIATYDGGRDHLYSIERIEWDGANDDIILGKGVELIQDNILFDLKGDGGGKGDKVSFLEATEGLLINAVDGDTIVAQSTQTEAPDKGLFIQSVEWIEGSEIDDRIYANSALRVVEGGAGDDFIDARLDAAFAGGSPSGFDIEISGGAGNDTILSGEGRTIVNGGAGADRFVFTTVNTGAGTPEFVIDGGDAADRLFVAYNFFNGSGNGFEGSELMPLLGAMFPFEWLQDPEGPGSLQLEWQLMSDILGGDSQVDGLVDIIGRVSYTLDGSDLLIHLYQGQTSVVNLAEDGLPPHYFTIIETNPDVEALIRVLNFTPGDLGIQFYDPGEPQPGELGDFYPNWDDSVRALLNDGEFLQPFDPRPAAPVYTLPTYEGGNSEIETSGSEADDVISVSVASQVRALGGNDQINGSTGSDLLDGGSGADTMAGGLGDDVYLVDDSGDSVVELATEGTDIVKSSISFALGDNVENLELTGLALTGTGNSLGNRLIGNDLGNVLDGGGGRDALFGGAGDDTLIGGAGSDFYLFFSGEGDDLLIDNGPALDIDTLAMGFGISTADLTPYRTMDAPQDLVLAVAGGGRITIKDFAGTSGAGIELLTFEDGTSWDRATIEAYGASAPILVNDLPQAITDDLVVVASPVGMIDPSTLLANDRDPDGDPLTIVSVSDVTGGTVTIDPDGRIRVATSEGFEGVVTFRYTISDTAGGTSTASATVEVVPNTDPFTIGVIPNATAAEATALDLTLPAGVFGDADGDWLYITAKLADGSPLPDWLSFDSIKGRLTGTPPSGSEGVLPIVIQATDGLASASQQFTLTVTPANAAPVAADDAGFSVDAGSALIIAASALLANDADPDGDALTIIAVANGTGGDVSLEPDGSLRFVPTPNYDGPATFSYTVADPAGVTSQAVVAVTVNAVPGQSIAGTSGNDTLSGGAGNDVFTLIGDGGTDQIDGGNGIDTVRGSSYNDIVRLTASPANFTSIEVIDGGLGNDRILGGTGDDLIDASPFQLVSIELIDGGAGNDTIIGSAGNDIITGNVGNDTLSGLGGDDVFTLAGDGGYDTIDGGAGVDTVRGSGFNDNIRIATGLAALTSIEIIDGGLGNDRILGGVDNDTIDLSGVSLISIEQIDGGAGNDTIIGSSGNDLITGNSGNDTLSGGDGDDVFTLAGDGGYDTVDGGAGYDTIQGSVYNDVIRVATGASSFTGIEAINGGDGFDRIMGGVGADVIALAGLTLTSIEQIDAGAGADTIIASASDDLLLGGAGSDTFVFHVPSGHDVIADFHQHAFGTTDADVIDLAGLGFAEFAAVMAAATQDGGDTIITLDGANSIRLNGVSKVSLTGDDFDL